MMKRLFCALLLAALSCHVLAGPIVIGGPVVTAAAAGGCGIAKVQQSTVCTGTTSAACTLAGVTAGNLLVSVYSYYAQSTGTSPVAPTDTNGTFTAAQMPTGVTVFVSDLVGAGISFQQNANSGSHTVTNSNAGGGSSDSRAILIEFSGVNTVALDQHTSANATTAQTNTSGTTGTTSQACELSVVALSQASSSGVASAGFTDPPSGYNSIDVQNNTSTHVGFESAYKVLNATGTQSVTWAWTDATTAGSQGVIATFKGP